MCVNALPHMRVYVATEGLSDLAFFQRWSCKGARVTVQPEVDQGPHLVSMDANIEV